MTPALMQNMRQQASDRSVEITDEWFDEIKEKLESEEKSTWEAEWLQCALVFLVIEGKTLLRKAKYGKGWRYPGLPERTDLPVYGFNYTGFYSEALKAQWTNSNTDIRWRPQRDEDNAQGAARAAQNVASDLKRKLDTNEYKQTEALLAQCGKYARYSYYTNKKKGYARRPKYETQQLQFGESSFLCPDCGAGGDLPAVSAGAESFSQGSDPSLEGAGSLPNPVMAGGAGYPGAEGYGALNGQPAAMVQPGSDASGESAIPPELSGGMGYAPMDDNTSGASLEEQEISAGICPACSSPNIAIEQAEPFEVEAQTGYEYIETGSILRESVPVFELKHDTTKSPQDSDYLIRSRRVRVESLQYEFPDLHISKANGDDLGLKLEESLKRSTQTQARGRGSSDSNDTETTDFIQIWLAPCLYANKRLKKDLMTRSGETIPAGTVLGDKYKKGLYLCFIEGVKGVIEMRDECHRDYWVGGVLRQRAISSLGSGFEDMVNSNMQLNLVYAIIFEQLRTTATPATLYDQRLLPNGVSSYIGSLSNIPVELAAVENADIRKAVFQLAPQPPTAQHFGYADKLNDTMQLFSRVTNFSGALPGVDNKTATGAQIGQSAAQSLLGPQLANKADVDRRCAEIELELFKVYMFDEVYISLQGRRGEQDGIWLSAANINVDLYAEVVPDSYLPQTNLERRERWDAFLQRVGGLPGLKAAMQESPEQVEQIADIFDVDLAGEDYSVAAETCRERIDQMTAAVPMFQAMAQGMPTVQMGADPTTGEMIPMPVDPMAEAANFLLSILQPPIELEEIGHMAAIQYLREWLLTDEGKKATPELRAGVKAMIYRHLEGLTAEAQLMGMLAMAGQPPMPAGQPNEQSKGGPNKTPDTKQTMGAPGKKPEKQPAMAGM